MAMKENTLRRIFDCGVIPVVRAPSGELAIKAVEALLDGGIDVIELTMTVPGAVGVIQSLVQRFGRRAVVGAGTVLDVETARACMLAGASFVVSPIFDAPTIAACRTYGTVVMPGALTPTEIVRAWQAGADLVKVFPCSAMGGASYLKSLAAPLPDVRFVPTGGVSLQNVATFIQAGASAVGVGSDLVDIAKIEAGNAQGVVDAARAYLDAVKTARGVGAKAG